MAIKIREKISTNTFADPITLLESSDISSWAKAASKPSYTHNEIGAGNITIGDGANTYYYRTANGVKSGFYYHTSGDESVVFANQYVGTGWMFVEHTNPDDRTNWQSLSPTLQIKKGGVVINKLIGQGASPAYNLDVNGTANATTIYENGTALSAKYQAKGTYAGTAVATTSANGLMSSTDKTRLDNIYTVLNGSDASKIDTIAEVYAFLEDYAQTTDLAALLANKLDKTAKAADADKLDGQDSSYYLNYNNLTNTPTIPTKSSWNYDDVYLKLAGGTLTGNLIFKKNGNTIPEISFQGSQATYTMIKFLDNTGDTYGNGISIGGGGAVVIGAGESADSIINGAGVSGGTETLYLGSDNNIYFLTNVQNGYANAKTFTFDASGNLTVPGSITEGETTLANKYLGKTAKATDSDKLDGHDSSYFYQASNPNGYTSNIGTVTQVKVGTTAYNPSSGVISLPAYPTTLPASDVYAWAKASTKPSYTASEVGALKNYGTDNSRPNGSSFTFSTGTNPVQMRSGATSGADIGIFYLSDDNAFLANSGDSGFNFAVFDCDKGADLSSADNAAFVILQSWAGIKMKGDLTVAGSISEAGTALSDKYQAKGTYATESYVNNAIANAITTALNTPV